MTVLTTASPIALTFNLNILWQVPKLRFQRLSEV